MFKKTKKQKKNNTQTKWPKHLLMSTCCLHVLSISIMIMKDYLRFVTPILICIVFILKKKIYSLASCIFCFHLSINTFFSVNFTFDFCCEPYLNEQKDLKATWNKPQIAQLQITELWQSEKMSKCPLQYTSLLPYSTLFSYLPTIKAKPPPQEISLNTYSWFNTRRLSRAAIQRN